VKLEPAQAYRAGSSFTTGRLERYRLCSGTALRLKATAKQKEPAQPPWPIMTNYQQLRANITFRAAAAALAARPWTADRLPFDVSAGLSALALAKAEAPSEGGSLGPGGLVAP